MQVSNASYASSPRFTGVLPVRVMVDGTYVTSPELIKKSCRQMVDLLTTCPKVKGDEQYNAMLQYLRRDYDYDPRDIVDKRWVNPKLCASNFIRTVHNQGRTYFLTGVDADAMNIVGKNVGIAKSQCRKQGISDSFESEQARKTYKSTIDNILRCKSSRVSESCDRSRRARMGSPVEMIIKMVSNGKYGKKAFKIKFQNVEFQTIK